MTAMFVNVRSRIQEAGLRTAAEKIRGLGSRSKPVWAWTTDTRNSPREIVIDDPQPRAMGA